MLKRVALSVRSVNKLGSLGKGETASKSLKPWRFHKAMLHYHAIDISEPADKSREEPRTKELREKILAAVQRCRTDKKLKCHSRRIEWVDL